jgi:hypothetical protein
MLALLQARHPAQALLFRKAALLPAYNLRILWLTLSHHRWFITPLFIWRCIGHQGAFWLKAYLPRRFLMAMRSRLRL